MADSINLGSVYATLELRDSDFNRKLRESAKGTESRFSAMQRSGEGLASSLSNSFDGISNTLGRTLKTVTLFATAGSVGFGAMIKAAIGQRIAVEDAGFALRAYEKNTKRVNNVLGSLVEYAQSELGVLFQREELFKAASNLKVYGDRTQDLTRHVIIMSKAVALGFTTFDELSQILGRIGSQGKLTGVDFDLLSARGIRLDKTMRNAKVTFDEVFQAINKAIPEGVLEGRAESIRGRMIRLQSSFRNLGNELLGVESVTDKFGNTTQKVVQGGVLDQFLKILDDLRATMSSPEVKSAFRNMGAQIAEIGSRVVPVASKSLLLLIKNVDSLIAAIGALTVAWITAKAAFAVTSAIDGVTDALDSYRVAAAAAAKSGKSLGLLGMARVFANPIAVAIVAIAGALAFLQIKFGTLSKIFDKIRPALNFIGGLFSDLWFEITRLAEAIGKELSPVMDFLRRHSEGLKQILKVLTVVEFAPLIASVFILIGFIKGLTKVIGFLADNVDNVSGVIKTLISKSLGVLKTTIENIKEAVNDFREDWDKAWASAEQKVETVRSKIQELRDTASRIGEGVSNFARPWREDFLGTLQSTLDEANLALENYITTTLGKWGTGMSEIGTTITNELSTIKNNVTTGFNNALTSVTTFFSELPTKITGFLTQTKTNITTWIEGVRTSMSTGAGNAVNSVTTFFSELPTKVMNAINGLIENVKTFFRNLPNRAKPDIDGAGKKTADNLINSANKTFLNIENIRKVGDTIGKFILLAVAAAIIYIADAGFRAARGLIRGFNRFKATARESIRNWLSNVFAEIGKFFAGVGNWLYDAGVALVQGFVNGIKSVPGKITEAGGWIKDQITSAASSALEIFSPSRVFARLGLHTIAGFIEGIRKGRVKLNKEVSALIGRASAEGLLKRANKLSNQLKNVNKRISKSNKRLSSLRKQRNEMIKSIKEGVISSTPGIVSDGPTNSGAIVDSMSRQLDAIRQFNKDVAQLSKKGLAKGLLRDIVEGGVETGGATARALAQASTDEIKRINNLQKQIGANAQNVGKIVGDKFFKSGIQAAQGLVSGLKSREKEIRATMLRIARSMSGALRSALGIRSPSKVFEKDAVYTMQGFEKGILKRQASLANTIRNTFAGLSGDVDSAFRGNFRTPFATANAGVGGSSSSVQIYGNIYLGKDVDADRFLTKSGLNRNRQLAERGMATD